MRNLAAAAAALLAALASAAAANPEPLLRTHAHNDYAHPRPLFDALDHGFCSVEADIYLIDGKLLVAHNRADVKPERTLEALYLDPLRERARKHGGRIYPLGPSVTLLIDFKTNGTNTWPVLRSVLQQYADILTSFDGTLVKTNAVTVLLTGNRPAPLVAAESKRLAALDGTFADFDSPLSPETMPWISESWQKHFQWRGTGPLPAEERKQLREFIDQAHRQGRKIRFWGAPDVEPAWREFLAAGADLINTDNLAGVQQFLLQPDRGR